MNFGVNLDSAKRLEILKLCAEFKSIFVRKPGPWEFSNLPPISIDTKDHLPIRSPPRKFPIHKRQAMIAEVQKLLDRGIIEPSDSPWLSQCIIVPKPKAPLGPDGLPQVRLVQDYRPLNEVTPVLYGFSQHKVPLISNILDSLRGHTLFSGIDFSQAFNQLLVREQDLEKNVFC